MGNGKLIARVLVFAFLLLTANAAFAAYHHAGEIDSDIFLSVYPEKAGTKLDSCNLCHSGGQYKDPKGKLVNLGACQWCHYSFGYDKSGDILTTLNPYGKAYKDEGRDAAAVREIDALDSDGDGFSNKVEVAATRFPGDAGDDPTKVTAPFQVFTKEQIAGMPRLKQFMLMNTHKSNDFYAEYTGVSMEYLLNRAGKLPAATGIKVFAPDGWAQFHPLEADPDPVLYPVLGTYPAARYYYDAQADVSKNPVDGWVEYNSPSCKCRKNGDLIVTAKPLKMILAYKRDRQDLTPGTLTLDNKLDGEGPFRVVPPQKNPGPPDQKSTATNQNVVWPFNYDADHSAGFSTRSATIIKVEPLPAGTTDIDTLEAGWNYVDQGKVVVYGAINPLPTVKAKLRELDAYVKTLSPGAFKHPCLKAELRREIRTVLLVLNWGCHERALDMLQTWILPRVDGCSQTGSAGKDDWVRDCEIQNHLFWSMSEVVTLLQILE